MTSTSLLDEYKQLLKKMGLTPNTSFGQNFLHSLEIAEWQVEQADIDNALVLEVGPGIGILTRLLAKNAKYVWAIENDKNLYKYLNKEFEAYSNVSIILGDALKIDFPDNIDRIVSNLPYSISKKFVKKISLNPVKAVTLMVQKEFANKLMAKPGDKNYRFISFLAQSTYNIKLLRNVPRNSFYPIPHVDSVIIKLTQKDEILIHWENYSKKQILYLEKIFERRNKKLRNSLKTLPSKTSKKLGRTLTEKILETRTREITPEIAKIILEEIKENDDPNN